MLVELGLCDSSNLIKTRIVITILTYIIDKIPKPKGTFIDLDNKSTKS
jgi:hypothetical protein